MVAGAVVHYCLESELYQFVDRRHVAEEIEAVVHYCLESELYHHVIVPAPQVSGCVRLDGRQDLLQHSKVGRFDQMVIKPGVLRKLAVCFLPVTSHRNQHDALEIVILPQPFSDSITVDSRQADV